MAHRGRGNHRDPSRGYGSYYVQKADPRAGIYEVYYFGDFCPVPARNPYHQQTPAPFNPYRRINTIAEEERLRILSLRKQAEEEAEQNRRLHEDHRRLMVLREKQNTERDQRIERQREIDVRERHLRGVEQAQREEREGSERRRSEREIRARNAASDLNNFEIPDEWAEYEAEIRRPITASAENIRAQNAQRALQIQIDKDQTHKELYERNIGSVTEMAKYKPKDPCSVCYDDAPESMLIMVCCKQYFCFPCISAWWGQKKSCPACRVEDPVFVEVKGKLKWPKEEKNII